MIAITTKSNTDFNKVHERKVLRPETPQDHFCPKATCSALVLNLMLWAVEGRSWRQERTGNEAGNREIGRQSAVSFVNRVCAPLALTIKRKGRSRQRPWIASCVSSRFSRSLRVWEFTSPHAVGRWWIESLCAVDAKMACHYTTITIAITNIIIVNINIITCMYPMGDREWCLTWLMTSAKFHRTHDVHMIIMGIMPSHPRFLLFYIFSR